MNDSSTDSSETGRIAHEGAGWVLRTDRGLSAAEQDAFSEWLARDPRHGAAMAQHRRHWQRLDQLAEWRPEHGARPNPDLLAPSFGRRIVRFAPLVGSLAAAAALVLAGVLWPARVGPVSPSPAAAPVPMATNVPAPSQRVLDDGSVVELNRGAEISVHFTAEERRVTLEQGEAHFVVAKNPARPFVVSAAGVKVRAVGTAFNVRLDAAVLEVLVTEGRVQLGASELRATEPTGGMNPPEIASLRGGPAPLLEARQRAVVSLGAEGGAPEIATLTRGEIERVLAWQHRLLDFTRAPLTEIVAEFNRRNVVQLVVIDPELAAVRVSAALRSDNVEGFVRLLEAGFGARAERRGETEILLRAAR